MTDEAITAAVASLLVQNGGRPHDVELTPCGGGGNNRVYRVVADGRELIAKWYFSDAADNRDRLGSEFAFLTYANRIGVPSVPTAIACDRSRHLALYEFIEGTPLHAGSIAQFEVDQARDFFLALNRREHRNSAADLPPASEACFSIARHLSIVDGRIARLAAIMPDSAENRDAAAFVARLRNQWERLKNSVLQSAPKRGLEVERELGPDERCISASDFGFHNALRRPSGEICFLDFEYAGWDDPAKMAGDFFSHPAIPVDIRYRPQFLAEAMGFCAGAGKLIARAELLFPVFQTKWCCIILNDFLPDSARRRRFANSAFDEAGRKRIQLAKATALSESIEMENPGIA